MGAAALCALLLLFFFCSGVTVLVAAGELREGPFLALAFRYSAWTARIEGTPSFSTTAAVTLTAI